MGFGSSGPSRERYRVLCRRGGWGRAPMALREEGGLGAPVRSNGRGPDIRRPVWARFPGIGQRYGEQREYWNPTGRLWYSDASMAIRPRGPNWSRRIIAASTRFATVLPARRMMPRT